MRCPKCGYVSFDRDACKRCGAEIKGIETPSDSVSANNLKETKTSRDVRGTTVTQAPTFKPTVAPNTEPVETVADELAEGVLRCAAGAGKQTLEELSKAVYDVVRHLNKIEGRIFFDYVFLNFCWVVFFAHTEFGSRGNTFMSTLRTKLMRRIEEVCIKEGATSRKKAYILTEFERSLDAFVKDFSEYKGMSCKYLADEEGGTFFWKFGRSVVRGVPGCENDPMSIAIAASVAVRAVKALELPKYFAGLR